MAKKTFTHHINFDALTEKTPIVKKSDNRKIIDNIEKISQHSTQNKSEKRFQTSLSINEDLHRQLKILGCNLKKPIREIIEEAIQDYLHQFQNQKT